MLIAIGDTYVMPHNVFCVRPKVIKGTAEGDKAPLEVPAVDIVAIGGGGVTVQGMPIEDVVGIINGALVGAPPA